MIGTPRANRGRAEIEEPDWIFCEHAGVADGGSGKADGEGIAGAGEEAGVRGAVASGHSVRAGSGVGAAGEELVAQPDIPGDVCMAEQGGGEAGTAGTANEGGGLVRAQSGEVRSYGVIAGDGGEGL